jgi:mRNA interferase HicA
MKRRELIKILTDMGCVLVRHGGNHDWYLNPETKQTQPVPRHNEVNELLARSIIRKLRAEDKKV